MDWLPPYLVPAEVVVVDSFPTTTSGKIDFAALADLAPPVADQAAAAGDGFTATQQAVGEIVREILAVPSAGVEDDLFAVGGNSLQVLRVLSRVRADFGVVLTPEDFFEDPTIRGIAAVIDATKADA